jgi:transcriptional antiterminator NusG
VARRWYVLRVQSGREDRAREGVERRIREAGLSHVVTKVILPTEVITEIKGGKKRVHEKKLYPGYVMVEMDIDDDPEAADEAICLVRETPGVSDFIGTPGRPVPMSDEEVDKMLGQAERSEGVEPEIQINVKVGQAVKIKEGPFENFDGVIEEINPSKGMVKVVIEIFGRPTPVDIEHWQVEPI